MRHFKNSLTLAIAAMACTSAVMPFEAKAQHNYFVYGVKTDFPMADSQTIYRDIYVSIGTNNGVKVGTHLDVFRSIPTTDDQNQKNAQNISFKIARLKVIHSEANVAVARVSEVLSAKDIPNSIFNNIMVGDAVEVSRK